MTRFLLALTAASAAVFADALNLFTALTSILQSAEETKVDSRASDTLNNLLNTAQSFLAAEYHKGLSAQLDQSGFEQSLSNPAMTAFITKFMESKGITYTDDFAFGGFVQYYDGACNHQSFKDLEEEMGPKFRASCHGFWVQNGTLLTKEHHGTVSENEFKAMLLQENIVTRAAAYQAAKAAEGSADDLASLREFVREYISALSGAVLNELKLDEFVEDLVAQNSTAAAVEDPLDQLTEKLMVESEKSTGAFLKLPRLASRSVARIKRSSNPLRVQNGIGMTASLDERGYMSVAATADNKQMGNFINRTAVSMGLNIANSKSNAIRLSGFARWYDSTCAMQSFAKLRAELHRIMIRSSRCGGGWVSADWFESQVDSEQTDSQTIANDDLDHLTDVFTHRHAVEYQ